MIQQHDTIACRHSSYHVISETLVSMEQGCSKPTRRWKGCSLLFVCLVSNIHSPAEHGLLCAYIRPQLFIKSISSHNQMVEPYLFVLPRKKVWTHLGEKLFFRLLNQKIVSTVVVILIVAFLLAMPPQLCTCEAIHKDFSGRKRWSSQRYSIQLFPDFLSLTNVIVSL